MKRKPGKAKRRVGRAKNKLKSYRGFAIWDRERQRDAKDKAEIDAAMMSDIRQMMTDMFCGPTTSLLEDAGDMLDKFSKGELSKAGYSLQSLSRLPTAGGLVVYEAMMMNTARSKVYGRIEITKQAAERGEASQELVLKRLADKLMELVERTERKHDSIR